MKPDAPMTPEVPAKPEAPAKPDAPATPQLPGGPDDAQPQAGGAEQRELPSAEQPRKRAQLGVVVAPSAGGLMVQQVLPDSPAARIGLHPSDQIVAVNGVRVTSVQQLIAQLQVAFEASPTVTIHYWRDGRLEQTEVELVLVPIEPQRHEMFFRGEPPMAPGAVPPPVAPDSPSDPAYQPGYDGSGPGCTGYRVYRRPCWFHFRLWHPGCRVW
jgi:membrane-associated protease RseP (regulator of RpoE activity)